MCSRDREAVAVVRKRAGRARDDDHPRSASPCKGCRTRRRPSCRPATAGDEAGELLAEAREQSVACGMAEGIVVVLEAVQVEQASTCSPSAPRAWPRGRRELAAVAETGEGVGASLARESSRACACSRRTSSPCRAITARIAGVERERESGIDRSKWSYTSTASAEEAAADRRDEHAQPSSARTIGRRSVAMLPRRAARSRRPSRGRSALPAT